MWYAICGRDFWQQVKIYILYGTDEALWLAAILEIGENFIDEAPLLVYGTEIQKTQQSRHSALTT